MAITVRELLTKWKFVVDSKPIDDMNKKVDAAKKGTEAHGKRLGGLVKTYTDVRFAVSDTIAVFRRILAPLVENADLMERLGNAAATTGVAVRQLSALQHAAQLTGVPFETLQRQLTIFNKRIGDAARGSTEASDTFRQLGVDLEDRLTGKARPVLDVFLDVAERMRQLPTSSARASFGMAIFGRSASELNELLLKGRSGIEAYMAEADRLGLTFGTRAAENAQKFQRALARLRAEFGGGIRQATQLLLPVLTEAAQLVRGFLRASAGGVSVFAKTAKSIGEALLGLLKIMLRAGTVVERIGSLFGRLFSSFGLGKRAAAEVDAVARSLKGFVVLAGLPLFALEDLSVFLSGKGGSLLGLAKENLPKIKAVILSFAKDVGGVLGSALKSLLRGIGDAIVGFWARVPEPLRKILERGGAEAKALLDIVGKLIKPGAAAAGGAAAVAPGTKPVAYYGSTGSGLGAVSVQIAGITINGPATPEQAREVARITADEVVRAVTDRLIRPAMQEFRRPDFAGGI